jgi:hypothetical protein
VGGKGKVVSLFTSKMNLLVQGEEKQMVTIFQIPTTGTEPKLALLLARPKIIQKLMPTKKKANKVCLFSFKGREGL